MLSLRTKLFATSCFSSSKVVLKAVFLVLNHDISSRICDVALNIVECLLQLGVVPCVEKIRRKSDNKENEPSEKRQSETSFQLKGALSSSTSGFGVAPASAAGDGGGEGGGGESGGGDGGGGDGGGEGGGRPYEKNDKKEDKVNVGYMRLINPPFIVLDWIVWEHKNNLECYIHLLHAIKWDIVVSSPLLLRRKALQQAHTGWP